MSLEVLDIETANGVATLWLDRPKRYNAMGSGFWEELPTAVRAIQNDPEVRSIVVAARGGHFSVGLDLTEEQSQGAPRRSEGETRPSPAARGKQLAARIRRMQEAITTLAESPLPVIAAIHGYCLGGGVDLATACDVRLAAADAVFSVRETRMAMVADVGTLQRLPGIVGKGIAYEICLTGDDVNAERAREIQLVNEVYPDADACLGAARSMAARMAARSPIAVQGTKQVLRYCEDKSVRDGLEYVATWNGTFLQSDDLKEAMQAFAEKRDPSYRGS